MTTTPPTTTPPVETPPVETLDYPGFDFEVTAQKDGERARLGVLRTPHGEIRTPAFIFCATKGTLKATVVEELEHAGVQVILSNTYHLLVHPGGERIERLGGLHGFTGWNGPMLTDSGGFQVFSLGHGSVADEIKGRRDMQEKKSLLKVTEEGALFRSYFDGSRVLLTPERSMTLQRQIGADLVVCFDECTPFRADRGYTRRSMEMTHRWADRCLQEFERHHDGRQALYGVVQGGVYEDLRARAAEFIASRPFFGHAIGGSLGGDKAQMYEVLDFALRGVQSDRPVHLLGIGGVDDTWEGVRRGVDTFDCVSPTRIARHGWALTRRRPWRINLRNSRFKLDERPLREGCECSTCRRHSRAYVHYLLKADAMQAMRLLTVCNVTFMTGLMAEIRQAVQEGRFEETRASWLEG